MSTRATARCKLFLMLSENWTIADPRNLRRLVEYAVIAEDAGLDGVVVGEHVVMGRNASYLGLPLNPRAWLGRGNQRPNQPHPSWLVLLSAMAAATSTLRLMAGAVLAPLHNPLLLAKELASLDLLSEGRLIVLPGVSWQVEEYAALGVPFRERGKILDEQLEIWQRLWTDGSPITHHGTYFDFEDVYVEPAPFRSGGPELWIGGRSFSPWGLRRAVEFAGGFCPLTPLTAEEHDVMRAALAAAGRDPAAVEIATFLPESEFRSSSDLLDLDRSLQRVPGILANGVSTLVVKPSQFIDDGAELPNFCHRLKRSVDALH